MCLHSNDMTSYHESMLWTEKGLIFDIQHIGLNMIIYSNIQILQY